MKNPKITVINHGSTYTPPVEEQWHPVVCPECYSDNTEDLDLSGVKHNRHYTFYTYYPYEMRRCRECGCEYLGQTGKRRVALYKGTKWLLVAITMWVLAYYIFGWNLVTVFGSIVVLTVCAFVLASLAANGDLDWP